MRRKTLLTILLVVLLLGGCLGGLALLLRHEPAFYGDLETEPGPTRVCQSNAFIQELTRLGSDIINERPEWQGTFSETQLNSYFEEHFIQSGVSKNLLPEGVSSPRISLSNERARLAFRYGTPPWSTVVSLDFRVWMAAKEVNVVVLELLALRAGALPISAQTLLEPVIEVARRQNIEVTWYRHNRNPVAVLKFLGQQHRRTAQLKRLAIHNGSLTIRGSSPDPNPQVQGGPALLTPRAN